MIAHRKITLCMQLIAVILMIASAVPAWADSAMPQNKVPGSVESTARRLMHDLTKAGYEVGRGYFKLYTQSDCPYSYEVLRTCLGNNPAAPYIIPMLPAWGDEWLDPAAAGMLGPTVAGYNPSYRLDPREAIVILGELPPPARYFGLQTYLLSRPGEWKEDSEQYLFVRDKVPALIDTFFTRLPKNQERLQLFADPSNPINNVVIENASDAVWEQLRYFVITPDQGMDRTVRQALARLGIPQEDAAYFMGARLPLPDNRVYALAGSLGTRTGNATYVGLGLNSSLTQLGFDNIDDATLAGTADSYDVPNHERFFLQYFARDCAGLEALTAGSHCYSVGDKLPACYDPADLTCAMLVFSVRDYLLPGTQRGPAAALTLSPRVIPLQRP